MYTQSVNAPAQDIPLNELPLGQTQTSSPSIVTHSPEPQSNSQDSIAEDQE